MGKRNMPEAITKSKILLVEGKDEVNLFTELLVNLDLTDIQVIEVSGKDKFPSKLEALVKKSSGYSKITSIGIVRDADDDPVGAFQSVCDAMSRLDLPKPKTPLQPVTGPPQITVMIVPDSATKGMIENVCLASVSDDPAMACVDQYFECLAENQRVLSQNAMPKARVHTFLSSRQWLEIAHFEYLQKCMQDYISDTPASSATAVPKVHAFLASRYTPDLNLGIAAQKSGREDGYWRFDHPAFEKIKAFLKML